MKTQAVVWMSGWSMVAVEKSASAGLKTFCSVELEPK